MQLPFAFVSSLIHADLIKWVEKALADQTIAQLINQIIEGKTVEHELNWYA